MAIFRTQKQPRRTPPSLRPFGPRRQRGVRPTRLIPIFPLPSPKIAFEDTTEEQYRAWEAVHGGTFPEYLAYRWLEKRGFVSGTDFIFQSSKMGGRQMPGGAVVDFDFPILQLAWRIQGERFHIGDPAVEAKDAIQKLSLTSIGYTVIDVFAQDLLERIEYVLSRAITGEQIVELAG